MYERLYESYYNDSEIDYQILNIDNMEGDVKVEFENNSKKI